MRGTPSAARRMLSGEARALLTRLDQVRPFAVRETMLPAAAPSPAAQTGIERTLAAGRRELRGRVLAYLDWLDGGGAAASPAEMQRRFTALRWRFNDVLGQFDLFQQTITQRSEHEVGLWLSGMDVAAADALDLPDLPFEAPPVVCYLDRGPGAAIRRARTRLPGGGSSPVAIVRVPRERMVGGYGLSSSLCHEVGHQGAALLGLVPSLQAELRARAAGPGGRLPLSWALFSRWMPEIVADFWAIGKLGVTATMGLIGVVSLPRRFVFRLDPFDSHPFPWIRVHLGAAIGELLHPDPQWRALGELWSALYPPDGLDPQARALLDALTSAAPGLADLLVSHRPQGPAEPSLGRLFRPAERSPMRLLALYEASRRRPELLDRAAPTLAFAVLGQARAAGLLSPEAESRRVEGLLRGWALRSTLATAAACARRSPPAVRPVTPRKAVPVGAGLLRSLPEEESWAHR
ncbi:MULTISPECIES: hypothetical protein [Streptomyces]|uniref:Uncharacterized protein n=1 Tax=Streptomyces nymphaeiformis TaxID=2663842 RepID=A0A7W7TWF8_9ACTN|nr:hypothetical protein [Streptomyces nymphaeiformis]MBB4980488.1 hypothetical protein [Streptomyces nymphaeiformis]